MDGPPKGSKPPGPVFHDGVWWMWVNGRWVSHAAPPDRIIEELPPDDA